MFRNVNYLLILVGILLLGLVVVPPLFRLSSLFDEKCGILVVVLGAAMLISGVFLENPNLRQFALEIFGVEIKVISDTTQAPGIVQKQVPSDIKQRQAVAAVKPVPGKDAPSFSLVEAALAFDATPCADPMVPMYLLDKDYRIVDWNFAFSLAFDRTMEGRRGLSVLEWVYFLDNYEEVLDHTVEAFSDPKNLPPLDVEEIRYTSKRYNRLVAIKRAYQVPKDDGTLLGWLVTLGPSFEDAGANIRYRLDLIRLLRADLMWTEYALSYDAVLRNTKIYRELLDTLLGENGCIPAIPPAVRVLDLGAGTGNITKQLVDSSGERLVFALESNRAMLDVLRSKCKPYLRSDDDGAGVVAVKQDINSLFGLQDDYFDCAILNNVTYSLEDPARCLRDTRRVLKPGGEVRISGPQKKSNLKRLFRQIRRDLQSNGKFEELRAHYDRVESINTHSLAPMLNRWTVDDVAQQLKDAGFSEITYADDNAYAGQSMIVCAKK
ncbi:MAG TPA: class I SAM-dependent methyltransferase [Thermoguttaceae bacterium]|nr:class I SAM-dependent methyltransferase [Thermoguttaceae bacterium]